MQRLYQAADGWFFLGARDSELPTVAGIAGLEGGSGLSNEALERFLEGRFKAEPVATWVHRLTQASVGSHALKTVREIMDDSWAKEHGISLTRDHPGLGLVDTIGPAPRLSRTPVTPGRPAPQYGADTAEILAEHGLGSDMDRLVGSGGVRLSQ
jgi:crotonobetainyl-CoA:carnitine CoA-transferase CaiB-like acyl-CoA transferase